jgi:hypothetical protein
MTKSLKTLILFLFLALTSCIPSQYPLYIEQDVRFDPAVLGAWIDEESGETWEITRAGDKKYKIVQTERDGKTSEYSAHLFLMGNQTFFNLTPKKSFDFQPGIDDPHLLTPHFFIRLSRDGTAFRASTLNPDWLRVFLEKNPASVRYQKINEEIMLTAPTSELRKFVLAHLETPGAFTKPVIFKQKESGK